MAARSTRKRKTEDSDNLNDLPIPKAKKNAKSVLKHTVQEEDLPEIYLPEIDLPLNSNIASEMTGKTTKRKTKSTSASIQSNLINNTPGIVSKPKFKTKASQAEYVSSKLEMLKGILNGNLANSSESIFKIQMTLDDLSSHNNKSSMFLENKGYKENSIKKKGLGCLDGIDANRYNLIKSANDSLSAEKQFDFYLFEAILEKAERKSEDTTTAKIATVYDSNGQRVKKFTKKDLKKKNKTYTSFMTSTFSPSYTGSDFELSNEKVWGGKGDVNVHYNDYKGDEFLEEFASSYRPYRGPWGKDSDSDDEPDHQYKTTTYRSYFLVFWPKSFTTENLVTFGVGSTPEDPSENNNQISKILAKTLARICDFHTEYAKSGRSLCNKCKEKITKDDLRFGTNIDHDEFSVSFPQWFHLECFFKNGAYFKKYHSKSLPENIDQIGGYEDLKPEDQKKVQEKIEMINLAKAKNDMTNLAPTQIPMSNITNINMELNIGNCFYSVRKGRIPGIYNTWETAQSQVKGYSGAEFKKFKSKEEAIAYLGSTNTLVSFNHSSTDSEFKLKGPVNGKECYFWRTTGCQFGHKCRYEHILENQGCDKQPWQENLLM